jgi:polyisoprenoid-binding protein YceI
MRRTKQAAVLPTILLVAWMFPATARAQSRAIDASQSHVTVHVGKTGIFSAFGDTHEVAAPLESGTVELSSPQSVQLKFDARKLRVLDPKLSAEKHAEVQETMLGPKVLDSSRFPEISFQSTEVASAGPDHWTMKGNLTLHGRTQNVVVDVALKDGRYLGTAAFKQRAFGIETVSAGGGTVKVKDELKIEFSIVLK